MNAQSASTGARKIGSSNVKRCSSRSVCAGRLSRGVALLRAGVPHCISVTWLRWTAEAMALLCNLSHVMCRSLITCDVVFCLCHALSSSACSRASRLSSRQNSAGFSAHRLRCTAAGCTESWIRCFRKETFRLRSTFAAEFAQADNSQSPTLFRRGDFFV